MEKMETSLRSYFRPAVVLRRVFPLLASLKLAVVLLVVLAAVIATATVLEADHGRPYAQWYVYHSGWFCTLLAVLGVNIFCGAASRWPWKRHQTGFVITHGGLLVLLAGSIQSFVGGVEGQVTLHEGETTTKMTLSHQSQITARWLDKTEEAPYEFTFEPGPVSWREGTNLYLGGVDGVAVRVRHYLSHARPVEDWVADESGVGGPLVRVAVQGPPGSAPLEHVLADQDYGDEWNLGPMRVQLQKATTAAMLDHFLKPPADPLGTNGVLYAYHRGGVERIDVDKSLKKKVPLGDMGIAVELAEYIPNAKSDAHSRFQSAGTAPRNPLLELKVHVPGEPLPLRQLAFAKSPLLTLDGVYGTVCPVKFQYRHPAVKPSPGVELLQAEDGKLYGRLVTSGGVEPKGEVTAGSVVAVSNNFRVSIAEYMRHARPKITFAPEEVEEDEKPKSDAAVEVEVWAAGVAQTLWLQRGDAAYGTRTVVTPDGPLQLTFGQGEAPLGFSVRLINFRRDVNPGGVGNATFASTVRVLDDARGVDEEHAVSMNEPLTYKRLTFYQASFNESGHGPKTSTFSVAYDPGRTAKYAGSLMICFGIATMFYMRAYFFRQVPRMLSGRRSATEAAPAETSVPSPGENVGGTDAPEDESVSVIAGRMSGGGGRLA